MSRGKYCIDSGLRPKWLKEEIQQISTGTHRERSHWPQTSLMVFHPSVYQGWSCLASGISQSHTGLGQLSQNKARAYPPTFHRWKQKYIYNPPQFSYQRSMPKHLQHRPLKTLQCLFITAQGSLQPFRIQEQDYQNSEWDINGEPV